MNVFSLDSVLLNQASVSRVCRRRKENTALPAECTGSIGVSVWFAKETVFFSTRQESNIAAILRFGFEIKTRFARH